MNFKVKAYCTKRREVEVFWLNLGRQFPALDLVPEAVLEDLRGTL